MAITFVFLALLFILGLLLTTLVKFPIPFFFQSLSLIKTADTNKTDHNKVIMKSSSSSSSYKSRKAELKSVFATFDKNKDGFISRQELTESLENIGISTSERDVVEMVEKVDVNGDGLIDFDEFCELFESMVSGEDGERENHEREEGDLKEAFDVFDGDKDGMITVEELGLVLASLGFKEGKKLEACKEMIRKVDTDGDGMVNLHEFKSMMKSGKSLISVSSRE